MFALTELLDKRNPVLSEAELKIPGYQTFYTQHPLRGVSIHVKESLNPKVCNVFDDKNFNEHVWCSFITQNNEKVLIGNIYKSPNSSDLNTHKLFDILKDNAINQYDKVYITGDFNFPKVKWNSSNNNNLDEIFVETLREAFLVQHVDKPTRIVEGQKQNILDLVITKAEEDVLNIDYCGHLGKSDHILLKITTNVLKNVHTKSNPDRYDFKRANYSDFKNFLNKKDWSVLSNMNLEEMWNYIHTTIQEGTEKFVPKVKSKSKRKTPAWFSPIIKKSVKKKHALFKRFLESQNSYHYKLYIQARNESARLVKNSKKEHQRNIAKKCKDNPKTFWNYVNTQRKVKENIAPLWDGKSSYINDDKGKADASHNFF